jgi:hypothetical protein
MVEADHYMACAHLLPLLHSIGLDPTEEAKASMTREVANVGRGCRTGRAAQRA